MKYLLQLIIFLASLLSVSFAQVSRSEQDSDPFSGYKVPIRLGIFMFTNDNNLEFYRKYLNRKPAIGSIDLKKIWNRTLLYFKGKL